MIRFVWNPQEIMFFCHQRRGSHPVQNSQVGGKVFNHHSQKMSNKSRIATLWNHAYTLFWNINQTHSNLYIYVCVYIFSEYRNEKWSVFMFLWCNKGVYHIDAHEAIWPQANVYRQLGTPTQYPLSTAYRTCFLYYSHTFSLFLFSDSLQFPGLLCQQSVILCLLKG